MAVCKFCHKPMAWGQSSDGRFVPLVPIEEHADLVRTFQDENGVLRAEHALICEGRKGGPTVKVTRLQVAVQPENIIEHRPKRKYVRKDPSKFSEG